MDAEPERHEFSEASLDSPEYRERLTRKLNCLIAVLEVATAKVRQSLAGPAPDVERLLRIQRNLQDTLEVCLRARAALERRGALPPALSADLARAVSPSALGARIADPERALERGAARGSDYLDESERRRFARLPKIDRAMIAVTDFDELARLLAQ